MQTPDSGRPNSHKSKDPLHGMTLEAILERLVKEHGWVELGRRVKIRCFNADPSIGSSLKFLRKTPWARKKVESLFVALPTRYIARVLVIGATLLGLEPAASIPAHEVNRVSITEKGSYRYNFSNKMPDPVTKINWRIIG